MDNAQMSAHAGRATATSFVGAHPDAHRRELGADATTRSRVRRWLHQLGSKAETRQALSRITDNAVLDDVVTLVGRDELLRCVWGGGRFRSRVADAYIGRLRRKLEGANVAIATIRGAGYRIVESPFESEGSSDES